MCLQGHQGFESLPLRQTFTPSLPRITKISNRESGSCTRLGETEQVSSCQLHQPNRREEAGSTPTFRKAALQVHRINLPTWRNRKYAAQWISTLETYVFPTIGDMKVDAIRKRDVLACLTPIWTAKPETARRVRQRMRSVFSWGMAHDYVEYNVAGEAIDAALPAMPKIKAHYRSLPYQDVPAALSLIEESRASKSAKLCFRFVVLTACCSGEARLATWDEIDREAEVWTVPSHRMKAVRDHRVPLSGLALRVVDAAAAIADGSGLLFPSPVRQGRPLSDITLTNLLRSSGLGDRATLHGFRSSFRIWATERTSASHAAMELALAHSVGSAVEQAYMRSDLLEQRRALMHEWVSYLETDQIQVDRDRTALHGLLEE